VLLTQQQTLNIAAVADGGSTCPVWYTPGGDPTHPHRPTARLATIEHSSSLNMELAISTYNRAVHLKIACY